MTDQSPPIMATADLSPVSPSPVHPSSPVVVPALQEQVDQIDAITALQPNQPIVVPIQSNVERPPTSNPVEDTAPAQENIAAQETINTSEANHDEASVQEENVTAAKSTDFASELKEQATQSLEETASTSTVLEGLVDGEGSDNGDDDRPTNDQTSPANEPAVDQNTSAPHDEKNVILPETVPRQPSGDVPDHGSEPNDGDKSPPETKSRPDENSPEDISAVQTAATTSPPKQPVVMIAGLQGQPQSISSISAATKPSSLPPRPPVAVESIPKVPHALLTSNGTDGAANRSIADNISGHGTPVTSLNSANNRGAQRWEMFQQEERKYVADARWDKFPEGSRLFIGNLSSERVSKKEVFVIFSNFGRLAQVSLKQAFGFVQYHTVSEGQAAMDNLQGLEIRGRKIHLEFSRTQKKGDEGDRRGSRGKDGRRDSSEAPRPRRDDFRPPREPSPRRGSHHYQDSQRDAHRHDGGRYGPRGRSRSPAYGGHGYNDYRRRSPSPHRRHGSESALDIPRRYGAEVPDVQFLLLQEVEREFVSWVQRAFIDIGLRIDVMFLNPRFSRDAVIQRQVLEGVHAVVELDHRSQQYAKIPLQVFDRSAGHDKARFDQYQDLDPHIAAQLVARTKSQAVQPHFQAQQQYGGSHYPPSAGHYGQPAPHAQPHASYAGQQYPPHPGQAPPAPYGAPAPQSAGGLDNATLQQILGTIQSQQGGAPIGANGNAVDVNALLAQLGGNIPGGAPQASQYQQHPHQQQHHQPQQYGGHPGNGGVGPQQGGGESAHHVQNIMSQLARYRQ